jgi:TRAP transporter TAXI family solute receptor
MIDLALAIGQQRARNGRRFLAMAAALCLTLTAAHAQTGAKATAKQPSIDVNDLTVGIVTGTVSGTYIQFGSDLSTVLDSPGKMRVLAVVGKGSMQNLEDILSLRGIDIGVVQSDVLTYIRKNGMYPEAADKLQYITKLYNEEVHVLARSNIGKLEDLRGQKVNFGPQGSGIALTASIIFDLMKIKVEATYDDPAVALEKLKQGEIAAALGVYGKPARIYDGLKPEHKVKFLPVPASLDLSQIYFPSVLTPKDYPNLIAEGTKVETLAVGAVMIVYGWDPDHPRYKKVSRFVELFFASFDQLQKPPRHQKWQEVNLAVKVPGWVRFPVAEQWLKRASATTSATRQTAAGGGSDAVDRFLSETSGSGKAAGDAEAKRKLIQAYDAWRRSQEK